MNADLREGMTDGSYKKVVRNRGGVVEHGFVDSRRDLADVWFGIHEDVSKHLPDGRNAVTPNYIPTPHPTQEAI
jgi:hypothetical protein